MAPIPKPKPPMFQGTEDKLTKLKKTTAVALRFSFSPFLPSVSLVSEFESVLGGIFNVVSGNVPLEQLVLFLSLFSFVLSPPLFNVRFHSPALSLGVYLSFRRLPRVWTISNRRGCSRFRNLFL